VKKICVLGNSHIAAIALGWKDIAAPKHPGVEMTFLGTPRDLVLGLQVSDGMLKPDSDQLAARLKKVSGGPSIVDPSQYDTFVVCGLRFGMNQALTLARTHWAESHKPDADRTPISDSCFMDAVEGSLRDTPAFEMIRRLKQITDKPVAVFPTPLPSEGALKSTSPKHAGYIGATRRGDDTVIAAQYKAVAEAMEDDALRIVLQPKNTLYSPLLTKDEMSRGGIGLSRESNDDLGHMNAAYGAAMIEAYLT
jgi:hypothetical protein